MSRRLIKDDTNTSNISQSSNQTNINLVGSVATATTTVVNSSEIIRSYKGYFLQDLTSGNIKISNNSIQVTDSDNKESEITINAPTIKLSGNIIFDSLYENSTLDINSSRLRINDTIIYFNKVSTNNDIGHVFQYFDTSQGSYKLGFIGFNPKDKKFRLYDTSNKNLESIETTGMFFSKENYTDPTTGLFNPLLNEEARNYLGDFQSRTIETYDAIIYNNLKINSFNINDNFNVDLTGTVTSFGNFNISNGLFFINSLTGDTSIAGRLELGSSLNVNNKFNVNSVNGNTTIAGSLNLDQNLNVNNNFIINKTGYTNILNNVEISKDLIVKEKIYANELIIDNGNFSIGGIGTTINGSLIVKQNVDISGNVNVNNKIILDASNGNVDISNNLIINRDKLLIDSQGNIISKGKVNFNDKFKINNDNSINISNNLYVGNNSLNVDTSLNHVSIGTTDSRNALNIAGDISITGSYKVNGENLTDAIPVGTIMPYVNNIAPTGWFPCDGRELSRSEYQELYDIIKDTYGNGNGTTTFNIPDMRGRDIIGSGQGPNLSQRNLGEKGGEEKHKMTEEELVSHSHRTLNTTSEIGGEYSTQDNVLNMLTGDRGGEYKLKNIENTNFIEETGDNQPFNVMQPYIVCNYIIKAESVMTMFGRPFNFWKKNVGQIYIEDEMVGIGTTNPQNKLEVNGNIKQIGENVSTNIKSTQIDGYFRMNIFNLDISTNIINLDLNKSSNFNLNLITTSSISLQVSLTNDMIGQKGEIIIIESSSNRGITFDNKMRFKTGSKPSYLPNGSVANPKICVIKYTIINLSIILCEYEIYE